MDRKALEMTENVHISEQADGDYECDIGPSVKNRKLETQVRSKMGDDGIPETHITYVPMKDKEFVQGFGERYNLINWSDDGNEERTEKKKPYKIKNRNESEFIFPIFPIFALPDS